MTCRAELLSVILLRCQVTSATTLFKRTFLMLENLTASRIVKSIDVSEIVDVLYVAALNISQISPVAFHSTQL